MFENDYDMVLSNEDMFMLILGGLTFLFSFSDVLAGTLTQAALSFPAILVFLFGWGIVRFRKRPLPKQVHTTLPSVEGGLGSMNIIKDPPKSFFTKRRDKVSDTQEITNMIGEFSGDRICEMIKVYPRGINPMVSVSYSNYGTNGGQYRGVTNAGKWGHNKMLNDGRSAYIGQAKLPIPLIDNGAFRPPVLTQYDLLPLSRLPRSNTKAWTQPCFISYAESVECPSSDKIRQIEQNNIHYKVNPTATFTIGQLLEEPSDIRQVFARKCLF